LRFNSNQRSKSGAVTSKVWFRPEGFQRIICLPSYGDAIGAAVVPSQIRAFQQLVTDGINGRLVLVGDVKGLAAAIMNAWDYRESLGQARLMRCGRATIRVSCIPN
jgi:glycosyltransferase involved in cell wall biosynthesis